MIVFRRFPNILEHFGFRSFRMSTRGGQKTGKHDHHVCVLMMMKYNLTLLVVTELT
jgi:hypothetical protein